MDQGYAPDASTLAKLLNATPDRVITALHALQEDHGVVLHPNSAKIWVIHPFSLAPTNFWVQCHDRGWWGNCAWCSLGIAALVDRDVTITTSSGARGNRIDIHIKNGRLVEDGLLVHFPVAMKNAWDNVIYTCSTMLVFEMEKEIDAWSAQHHIEKGDVQPLSKIWPFARVWYGNHLNPEWKKWTAEEARNMFQEFGLTGPIWEIPVSDSRF